MSPKRELSTNQETRKIESLLGKAAPQKADLAAQAALQNARKALFQISGSAPQVGRFLVLGPLGAGGMGDVFEAYDPRLERKIALKVIRGQGQPFRLRLLQEARALARLSHPNVISVYEAEAEDDHLFIAMELVRGVNLRQWLLRQEPTKRSIARVFAEAGRGLHAAHLAGMTHGDFKPENVMIGDDGRVLVADFGLARTEDFSEESSSTNVGDAALSTHTRQGGTPAYMAPEVAAGKSGTPKSDQFSFCISLYEALTGSRPSPLDGELEVALPTAVPAALSRALHSGLASSTADRSGNMSVLISALEQFSGDRRRNRRILGGTLALGLALGSIGALGLFDGSSSQQPSLCESGSGLFAKVWNDSIAAKVEERFNASGRKHASDTSTYLHKHIDQYREHWLDAYKNTCEATHVRGDQSAELLDQKMSCLGDRLVSLDALAKQWSTSATPQAVDRALTAVAELPALALCNDPHEVAVRYPAQTKELADSNKALHRQLAKADALYASGQTTQAMQLATDVAEEAKLTKPLGIRIAALKRLAELNSEIDQPRARQHWQRVLEEASVGGMPWAAADAAIALYLHRAQYEDDMVGAAAMRPIIQSIVDLSGRATTRAYYWANVGNVKLTDRKEADAIPFLQQAIEVYESEIAKNGSDRILMVLARGKTSLSLARAHSHLGQFETATKAMNAAQHAYEEVYPSTHPGMSYLLRENAALHARQGKREEAVVLLKEALSLLDFPEKSTHHLTASLQGQLGEVLISLGRAKEARRYLELALADMQQRLGTHAAFTLNTQITLATALRSLGVLDKAEELLRDAIAIQSERLGNDDAALSYPLNALGNLLVAREDMSGAAAQYRRVVQIYERAYGAHHPSLSIVLGNLGAVFLEMSRYDDAEVSCKRSLAIAERAYGAAHPDLAYHLTCLGEALLGQGQSKAAQNLLGRALRLQEGQTVRPEEAAATLFALARALVRTSNKRSLRLARQASLLLSTEPADSELRRKVSRWLSRH